MGVREFDDLLVDLKLPSRRLRFRCLLLCREERGAAERRRQAREGLHEQKPQKKTARRASSLHRPARPDRAHADEALALIQRIGVGVKRVMFVRELREENQNKSFMGSAAVAPTLPHDAACSIQRICGAEAAPQGPV